MSPEGTDDDEAENPRLHTGVVANVAVFPLSSPLGFQASVYTWGTALEDVTVELEANKSTMVAEDGDTSEQTIERGCARRDFTACGKCGRAYRSWESSVAHKESCPGTRRNRRW